MRRRQRFEHLLGDRYQFRRTQAPLSMNALAERLPREVLHDHVRSTVAKVTEIVHLHDVRRTNLRRARLTFEARDIPLVPHFVHDLDRNASPHPQIGSFVNAPHPTRAQNAHDLVFLIDEFAWRKLHDGPGSGSITPHRLRPSNQHRNPLLRVFTTLFAPRRPLPSEFPTLNGAVLDEG